MIPFTSTASDHIQFLLQNLDASNLDSVSRELCEYTAYIVDESIILIRAFLDHLNINGNKRKNVELESVFASVFKNILNKSSFSTVFCEALVNTSPSQDFLEKLSDIVHLSTSERIGIGLALSGSENIDFRMCGNDFCLSQIVELCPQRMCGISADRIHQILLFLNQSKGLYEHLDAFMQLVSLSQLDGEVQFILFPFISDELHEPKILRKLHFLKEDGEDYFDSLLSEMERETSIADVMKELGYSCTANVSQCKKTLSLFSPLTEVTIARVVGTISRNHVGLEDSQNIFSAFRTVTGDSGFSDTTSLNSWNPEVLVDSIKQLAPGINWTNVFENLDHEGFYIPSNESFAYFMSIYKHVCQDPFPLHVICGSVWKNIKGQISFLKYAVSVPPEEFTFALSGRQLGDMDVLNGPKLQLGKGNHAWSCLDLLEVLCLVAERGHANTVRSILEYPVKHCPEVLLLGMAHVNTAYNLIQKEVSSAIFTGILNNVPGSGMLLHLWHVNPSLLLWGFTDTLNVNQESVFRILDVCQELKILSQVLDMLPSFFGIRLAAVSSAKELLDLEKWLITNLTAYKDAFYEECLRFLKEVQAGAQEVSANQLQPSGGLYNTFSETCSTFLKVLQSHAGNLSSHHLYEEMENLYASYLDIVRSNNTVDIDSSTTDGYADDIEAEANSYFHQVFSGQLTIDGIVQILTRLKESPETRENLIFECMIANLFEEYKSFSEYPEIQLKIAAVLLGSLIKHQLVTHISLGVALWAILHALCKPADSKMFVFGEKALEQFLDRLTEWPQYCNYILQISHLRANHSDLVAFVERSLARISSAHSKPDPLHGGSVDHQSPNQTQLTNSEMPVSSCHFTGSGASHLQLQVPSSLQHPKRQQHGLVKGEVTPSLTKYVKPTTSSAGQFYCTTSSDISGVKPQNVVNASVPVRSSSSLFRPPHGITHAGFGSALNIETLVAAAERRETPIEAPASEIQDNISFSINNLSDMNIEDKAKEVGDILKEQYFPWFAQYMVMKRASIEANFHDLYLKFLDKLNSKLLNKEILQVTYENCKVLLGSELIKSSSEERSLLKNLGSWLGKITIGRNQFLRALDIDPKSLILEAYERGLMIAVIPFISKILEPCLSSIAYRPPNPWTMGILGLLAEIYALPNLKMNLKFDIQVLFKNLGVDMKDVSQTSLVKHRVREVEGNPDFSIIDVGYSQQLVGEVKSSMILNKIQIEVPPEVTDSVLPSKHARVLPQIQYAALLDKASVSFSEDEKLLAVRSSDQLPPAQLRSQLAEPASIIEQQVVVNPTLHASGLHLPFRRALTIAMDRATKEIVLNIVHRTVSVANQTTKELILKDYAMEADENRIHSAAQLMVTCLAGSLIHVTCKEPLRNSISIQLRNSLQGLNIASELLEHAVLLMTNDNLDLGCAVIEQAAKKKATHAINGEMAQLLSVRRKHREGVDPMFFDTSLYAEGYRRNLPEAPCPKPGHLSLSQQQVYEHFGRLPWQNQSNQNPPAVGPIVPSTSSAGGIIPVYVPTSGKIDTGIHSSGVVNTTVVSVSQPLDIVSEEINTTAAQILRNVSSTPVGLGEDAGPHNLVIGNIVQSYPSVSTDPSSAKHAVVVQDSGVAVQKLSISFASDRSGAVVPEPLLTTGDALDKNLLVSDKLEALSADGAKEAEIQVSLLFDEWHQICNHALASDTATALYVSKLQKTGLLKGDETTDRFFHLLTEISISRYLSTEVVSSSPSPSFCAIDIYAKLVYCIVKFSPLDQGFSKFYLLSKVLAVTWKFIHKDAEKRKIHFNPRPYSRLFIKWILDLCSLDPVSDGANFQVLTSLANALHALQPLKVPGFSFAWLEVVSHRSFMPKLLTCNAEKGWPYFQRLLLDLLQFMEPFLRNAALGESTRLLYLGTLRVLLVLHHDFPEFLCDYHLSFCDVIPSSCIQMRNIILSAYPRNMRLPDPSTPNSKIGLLFEMNQSPRTLSNVDAALKAKQMKNDVDEYLKTRQQGSAFLGELKLKLLLSPNEAAQAGTPYSVPLINSLVLYVGMQAIQLPQTRNPPNDQSMISYLSQAVSLVDAALDIFQTLITDLDTEGRYLFLNAVADQLRYPNNHTNYFSSIIRYLFAESNQEVIQEQIIRVLLERVVANRPHPWGLLVTCSELIKDPRYKLWRHSFIRQVPEIEKLLELAEIYCWGSNHVDESVVSGGMPGNMQ